MLLYKLCPSRQDFEKTRLNPTIGNRDCDPLTLKKRTPFFACFAFSCVLFSVFDRENGENCSFWAVKRAFSSGIFWSLKTMRFNAQKLEFSPFSRSKSENETQENAKHAKNGVLFLRVSGSQSRFPIVGFKRVFFKFLSAWV